METRCLCFQIFGLFPARKRPGNPPPGKHNKAHRAATAATHSHARVLCTLTTLPCEHETTKDQSGQRWEA